MQVDGEVTSLEIVSVFIKRTILYGIPEQYTADVNFLRAIATAKEKDRMLTEARESKKLDELPLLHGIPFSIKDMFHLKGTASTLGLLKRALTIDHRTSPLVELLMREGAYVFVKSHTSQFTVPHTISPLFGESLHAMNKKLSGGGSTGGEGGLITTGCSPFGIGTNIGGSVNVPSAWNGLAGLSTTYRRLPAQPWLGANFGFNIPRMLFNSTTGLMAKYADDIRFIMQACCQERSFRRFSEMAPLPFNVELCDTPKKRKLRFGVYDLGVMKRTPITRRALQEARDILERAGHECVDIPTNAQMIEDVRAIVSKGMSPAQKNNSFG